MQLVLNTYGLQLSQRNRCFCVETKTGSRIISPLRITSILVTRSANLTSSAILLAAEHNIPIVLVDHTGQPQVKIHPALSPGLTALRKKQLQFSKSPASVLLVKQMLAGKTAGHISNIAWWANRMPGIAASLQGPRLQLADAMKKLEQKFEENSDFDAAADYLRSWESITARYYWQAVALVAEAEGWEMNGRTYRPAADEFNTALNYLYGMLYNQVETAIACAGLDSQIGIWHRDNYQTPSLAFDAIEPFRPKIDLLLMDLITQKKLPQNCFEPDSTYGYLINKIGRLLLVTGFNNYLEDRLKMNAKVTQFKNHILQAGYTIKDYIEANVKDEE